MVVKIQSHVTPEQFDDMVFQAAHRAAQYNDVLKLLSEQSEQNQDFRVLGYLLSLAEDVSRNFREYTKIRFQLKQLYSDVKDVQLRTKTERILNDRSCTVTTKQMNAAIDFDFVFWDLCGNVRAKDYWVNSAEPNKQSWLAYVDERYSKPQVEQIKFYLSSLYTLADEVRKQVAIFDDRINLVLFDEQKTKAKNYAKFCMHQLISIVSGGSIVVSSSGLLDFVVFYETVYEEWYEELKGLLQN